MKEKERKEKTTLTEEETKAIREWEKKTIAEYKDVIDKLGE